MSTWMLKSPTMMPLSVFKIKSDKKSENWSKNWEKGPGGWSKHTNGTGSSALWMGGGN